MNEHLESLKRVFKSIKKEAKGFRKDKLARRIKGEAHPDVPLDPTTMEPGDKDPLEQDPPEGTSKIDAGAAEGNEEALEGADEMAAEAKDPKKEEEEKHLKMIREMVRRA